MKIKSKQFYENEDGYFIHLRRSPAEGCWIRDNIEYINSILQLHVEGDSNMKYGVFTLTIRFTERSDALKIFLVLNDGR